MKSKGKNKKEKSNPLLLLAMSIGDFIRYWGFRRIHGAAWCVIHLSEQDITCTQLAKILKVSKALISPALAELIKYKLIFETDSPNNKTKIYKTNPDFNSVIKSILKEREKIILKNVTQNLIDYKKEQPNSSAIQSRIDELDQMISAANLLLRIVLAEDDIFTIPDRIIPSEHEQ